MEWGKNQVLQHESCDIYSRQHYSRKIAGSHWQSTRPALRRRCCCARSQSLLLSWGTASGKPAILLGCLHGPELAVVKRSAKSRMDFGALDPTYACNPGAAALHLSEPQSYQRSTCGQGLHPSLPDTLAAFRRRACQWIGDQHSVN